MNKNEWRDKYMNRLIELGVDEGLACSASSAADCRLDDDPVEAADSELSYWAESEVEETP